VSVGVTLPFLSSRVAGPESLATTNLAFVVAGAAAMVAIAYLADVDLRRMLRTAARR
jgi:hypothetical protein